MQTDLLLVGSVPLDTPVDVLELCGSTLGPAAVAIPDGETNERIWWVNMLAYRVYDAHPDVEVLNRPGLDDHGRPQWKPKGLTDMWSFRVRPGVSKFEFAELCYAYDAIYGYKVFRMLRDAGRIAPNVRYMVALPMTNSGVDIYFRDPAERPRVHAAFEAAMRREIDLILEHVPARDLLIQWDVCIEVLDIEGFFPWSQREGAYEYNTAAFGHVSPHVPAEVMLGYHFCYGTLGGWPMLKPKDLDLCTRLSNTAYATSGRRVDYVHMPVPRHVTLDYFAPLKKLGIGKTRVYLGLIHNTDDVAVNLERVKLARQVLPQFGLASVCGLGRLSKAEVAEHLRLHRDLADACAAL